MWTATEHARVTGFAEPQFHPELRRAAFLIPRFSIGPTTTRLLGGIRKRRVLAPPPVLEDVAIRDEYIAGTGQEPLRIRVFVPASAANGDAAAPRAALIWIHGGGFIMGHPEHDQDQSIALCRQLGIVVVAVSYRLGPDHPFPEPIEDCYAALAWLHANASALQVDPARVMVGGASAGAGLAAGLALLAHDRGALPISFQLLIYPMIDDRTATRRDVDERWLRIWSAGSNYTGWRAYLGREPGGDDVPAYAAPARRKDLGGLPAAWIGVGTCDLFYDEDTAYAARLQAAGVPCALEIVDGAFHAFDIVAPKSAVVADFRRSVFDAIRTHINR